MSQNVFVFCIVAEHKPMPFLFKLSELAFDELMAFVYNC